MEKIGTPIEKGTILVAYYSIGYWPRYAFFRVKEYTRSGAPRVRELTRTVVSERSTPVDSNTEVTLNLDDTQETGLIRNTRWSKKEQAWVIRLDEGKHGIATLSDYIPGKVYSEPTYG